jgi:hypothetical protein
MISMNSSLFPNNEEVASKIMDGELIIINLSTGVYYSMDNVGPAVWEMIEKGYTILECAEALAEGFEVTLKMALTDVKRLVEELLEENLIYLSDHIERAKKKKKSTNYKKLPYEPPKLNIYRDMEDLLALDPPVFGLEETSLKESNGKKSKT